MHTYPADTVERDAEACSLIFYLFVFVLMIFFAADKAALDSAPKGSLVTIFTPDDTHFDIAKYAIEVRRVICIVFW